MNLYTNVKIIFICYILPMKYEIIKGRINGKTIGDVIELSDDIVRAYGFKYVKAIDSKNEEITETKEAKNIKNKFLSSKETNTRNE